MGGPDQRTVVADIDEGGSAEGWLLAGRPLETSIHQKEAAACQDAQFLQPATCIVSKPGNC